MFEESYLEKEQSQKKGKFFEFIQEVDKIDKQPDSSAAKKDYDLSELDITFDRVTSSLSKQASGEEGK